jgi:crossover junction endodeoxyribonuclease RuvC
LFPTPTGKEALVNEVVIGVDPGLNGGVAALTLQGRVIFARPMPTCPSLKGRDVDARALHDLLSAVGRRATLAVVEKVASRPKQGVVSVFNFGVGYGIVRGVLGSIGVPLKLVTPQAWQKFVFRDLAFQPDTKAMSAAFCTASYPGVSLLAGPRCRVPHDGITDALCIAEYARLVAAGDIKPDQPKKKRAKKST